MSSKVRMTSAELLAHAEKYSPPASWYQEADVFADDTPTHLPCPHCSLLIPVGTYHEGHAACLEAIEHAMTLCGRTGEAIEILRRYGEARHAAGEVDGRLGALAAIARDTAP